jgi:hypothetical protein
MELVGGVKAARERGVIDLVNGDGECKDSRSVVVLIK